jgi:hypothetical protein
VKANVTAKGYVNVVLALNMKRFVAEKDKLRFDRLRGTKDFGDVLCNIWPKSILSSGRFETVTEEKQHRDINDEMSTEEIGFATGIFRAPMLEEFTSPNYVLIKEGHKFPEHLVGNFQFKNLFISAWNDWNIFIRPTYTGLFIIRLTRQYEKPVPLMDITHDVIKLQESLDVQSARRRLAEIETLYAGQPELIQKNRSSVLKFLEWLGTDEKSPTRMLYAPVQWKLAMEVAKILIESVGFKLPAKDNLIELNSLDLKNSNPLHDSYIIYHLDELWANRRFIPKNQVDPDSDDLETTVPVRLEPGNMQSVRPENIRHSLDLQQQLASLIEGALLKKDKKDADHHSETVAENDPDIEYKTKYSPRFEPDLARGIFKTDIATWQDELCVITPRATLLIPSYRSRHHELLIATLPGSTSHFDYVRYWGAVERMIEFVIEIQVLARLVERQSFYLLEKLSEITYRVRDLLFSGDIQLPDELPSLVAEAALVRRLNAFCRGLSNPRFWGRAEYATSKSEKLMEQLGLNQLLEQIEKNIDSINSVVDHVDEWYIADLAEQSNDMATLLSLGLAAVSFILTLLALPSFWVDLSAIHNLPTWFLVFIKSVGTTLAFILMAAGVWMIIVSIKHWKQIKGVMNKSLIRLRAAHERRSKYIKTDKLS